MKPQSIARASVECEFNLSFAQVKDDSKISLTTAGCASVARNLPINFLPCKIHFLKYHIMGRGDS
jgi:hypothetical protein